MSQNTTKFVSYFKLTTLLPFSDNRNGFPTGSKTTILGTQKEFSNQKFIYKMYTEIQWGNMKGRDQLEGLGVNLKIALKCVLKKWDGMGWAGLIWLKMTRAYRVNIGMKFRVQ